MLSRADVAASRPGGEPCEACIDMEDLLTTVDVLSGYLKVLLRDTSGIVPEVTRREYYRIMRAECDRIVQRHERALNGETTASPDPRETPKANPSSRLRLVDRAGRAPSTILVVEDEPVFARLVEAAIDLQPESHQVWIARDGAEAWTLLNRVDTLTHEAPDLILLDLNLPGMHGLDLLRAIKADEHLRRIPIIVWSACASQDDWTRVRDLQASCCMEKPHDLRGLRRLLSHVEELWLGPASAQDDKPAHEKLPQVR